MKRLLFLIACVALPLRAQEMPKEPPKDPEQETKWKALMQKGKERDAVGRTRLAAGSFDAAAQVAATPEQRVASLLSYIDATRGSRRNADLQEAEAQAIAAAYTTALTDARGALSFKVHNDYGVLLIDRGNAAAAVRIFAEGETDLSAMSKKTASRYLYNFALAHLKNGETDAALATYRRSLQMDPTLDASAKAAFSLIGGLQPERAAREAAALVDLFLDQGERTTAASYLHASLAKHEWHEQSEAMMALIGSALRYLSQTATLPDAFEREWKPTFDHLRAELPADAQKKLDQLVRVYVGDALPLSFEKSAVLPLFSSWSDAGERTTLSRVLKSVGDEYARQGKSKPACARYIAAWRLDPDNVDAITYMADLLLHSPGHDSDALFEQLVGSLFDQKGEAYESKDLASAIRLHNVLGSIFEARERWGPENDPYSALFHYRRAVDLSETLQQRNPSTAVSPGLNAKLATAYQRVGNQSAAWNQFILAAEKSATTGDFDAAELMLSRAKSLNVEPDPAQQARLQRLAEALPKGDAHVSDADIAAHVKRLLNADPAIDLGRVDVSVTNGVVTLKGTLGGRQAEAAANAAQTAAGVTRVETQIVPPR